MSKVIYKYILDNNNGVNEIMLPKGSEVVGCIFQENINKASIYVLQDNKPILCNVEQRLFKIYTTGEVIVENIKEYIGKFEVGKLVFHIVELNKGVVKSDKNEDSETSSIDTDKLYVVLNGYTGKMKAYDNIHRANENILRTPYCKMIVTEVEYIRDVKERYVDIVEVNSDGTINPSFRINDEHKTSGYLKYFNSMAGKKVRVTVEVIE